MKLAKGQRGEQANRIEMAGVIGHEHKGTVAGQMLRAGNFKAMINAQRRADDHRHERAERVNEHVRFAGKIPEPLRHRLVEIIRGRVAPTFHFSG